MGQRSVLAVVCRDGPKPEYARPVLMMARKLLRKAEQLGEDYVYTVRDHNTPHRRGC
jgi:hypothetical protein